LPDGGEYLITAMNTLGPTRHMPMGGLRAADWPEIAAFMDATGLISDSEDAVILHDLCEAFRRGLEAGKDPFKIPPMDR
jgi:hypothetical protein